MSVIVVTVELVGDLVEFRTDPMPDFLADLVMVELSRDPDLHIKRARVVRDEE